MVFALYDPLVSVKDHGMELWRLKAHRIEPVSTVRDPPTRPYQRHGLNFRLYFGNERCLGNYVPWTRIASMYRSG
jgi:hypothetical protein